MGLFRRKMVIYRCFNLKYLIEKKSYLNSVKFLNRTLNSEYKLIYRYKISFFVFEIIEIKYEFEISPWAYFRDV
jgi:hypothetical protein